MILGNLFAYPLHPYTWKPPAGSRDYRVTTTYYGKDLINGGIHRAVDVGNFRTGDPVYAPVNCLASARIHFDGAIGVIFDLGNEWLLEAWHLEIAFLGQNPLPVVKGALVGRTGASGKVFGGHTHIELKHRGIKVDPEPFLPMAERPAQAIPMEAEYMFRAIIQEDWTTGIGPDRGWFLDKDGNRKHFTAAQRITTVAEITMVDGTDARLAVYPPQEPIIIPRRSLTPIPGTWQVGAGENAAPLMQKLDAIRKAGGW